MSNELKEARRKAQEFVAANLSECCAEEIEWQDTGMLCDGKLREAAKLFGALDKPHALPLAQSEVARQAMRRAAAAPSVASGAQGELPPLPKDGAFGFWRSTSQPEKGDQQKYSADQMQAYARAAILANSAPNKALTEALKELCDLVRIEVADGVHTEEYRRASAALSAAGIEVKL